MTTEEEKPEDTDQSEPSAVHVLNPDRRCPACGEYHNPSAGLAADLEDFWAFGG